MSSSDASAATADAIRSHARLFDTEQQAVIATTVDGEIVHWNRAAQTIYGWTAEEVSGRHIAEITPAAVSREFAETIFRQLQLGRAWTGQFKARSKTGEEFEVSVRDMPVRNDSGDLIGVVGVSTRGSGPQSHPAGRGFRTSNFPS